MDPKAIVLSTTPQHPTCMLSQSASIGASVEPRSRPIYANYIKVFVDRQETAIANLTVELQIMNMDSTGNLPMAEPYVNSRVDILRSRVAVIRSQTALAAAVFEPLGTRNCANFSD